MEDFKMPTLPAPVPPSPNTAKGNSVEVENEETAKQVQKPESQQQDQPTKSTAKSQQQSSPYKIPPWSNKPAQQAQYKFEVLKSGQIIDEIKDLQLQECWKFGRLPDNDIEMAHPTISRFHAVLQYRPKTPKAENEDDEVDDKPHPAEGWYIYDLESTHGTFLNKQRIPARVFIRIRVGHMLRLGSSTRTYILQGPVEDEEPESDLSVTELRAQRAQQAAEAAAEAQRKAEEAAERERNEGISWGMAEDANEETDLTHNPYAATNNEDLFLDDPKRTLRGYFEREGLQMEYKCDEMSTGSFVCRVELPIDDSNGRPIIAEVVHKGRKKECVLQCALEACRILDRHGVLRQANQEPQKRKVKSQDSDSDDDEFWDRTGDVARKKLRKANAGTSVTLTYEDLLKQEGELLQQLQQVENDIMKYHEKEKRIKAQQQQAGDDLDSFMDNLNDDATKLDKTEIRKLRLDQQRIKTEQQKLQRLIKIAKPMELSFDGPTEKFADKQMLNTSKTEGNKKQLPMIGKRNQFSKFKVVKMPTQTKTETVVTNAKALASDEEEEELGEDDENKDREKDKDEDEKQTSAKNSETIVSNTSQSDNNITVESEVTEKPTKQYGPAIIPQEILMHATNDQEESTKNISNNKSDEAIVPPVVNAESEENIAKKRRQQRRQRSRNKRQEIDIDELDEHESSEKYAKWVPPENQSGDGYTKLNEKYGY